MSWFLSALSDSVVALRKESVDRNVGVAQGADSGDKVALRKESVDRNFYYSTSDADWVRVALRKESVDRNVPFDVIRPAIDGRSPQGERG